MESPSSVRDPNETLVTAAGALVYAAAIEVESDSLDTQRDSAEALKSIRSDMQALKDHAMAQTALLEKQNDLLAEQMKLQRIGTAIREAKDSPIIHFFSRNGENSHDLLKNILMNFRRGRGYFITGFTTTYSSGYFSDEEDYNKDGEKDFQDKLSNQLEDLLGVKPKIRPYRKGVAVFYE